jgi:hypothetical protein
LPSLPCSASPSSPSHALLTLPVFTDEQVRSMILGGHSDYDYDQDNDNNYSTSPLPSPTPPLPSPSVLSGPSSTGNGAANGSNAAATTATTAITTVTASCSAGLFHVAQPTPPSQPKGHHHHHDNNNKDDDQQKQNAPGLPPPTPTLRKLTAQEEFKLIVAQANSQLQQAADMPTAAATGAGAGTSIPRRQRTRRVRGSPGC